MNNMLGKAKAGKILIALMSMLTFDFAYANLFGPKDAVDCIQQNISRVRLFDATQVLKKACVFGYEETSLNKAEKNASKCITKGAANMYSYDSTLKVVNDCTKNSTWLFGYYKNVLMTNANDAAEESARIQRFNQNRIEKAIRDNQTGPISIFDANTGEYKNCIKNGGQLTCF